MLERSTRVMVLASAFVAVAWELWIGRLDWDLAPWVGGVAAIAAIVASVAWGRIVAISIFAAGYLVPVLFLAEAGRFRNPFFAAWLLPLLVAMLATSSRDYGWALPRPLKAPLAFWALVIAISWPIVILREVDFHPGLFDSRIGLTGVGLNPLDVSPWIMNVALTHMVGILWFDWLWRQFRAAPRERFESEVVESLAVVAAVGALLAAYQGLVDITWLAGSQWPAVNRAGGSLVDGNASGMLMALWSTLFLTLVFSSRRGVQAFGWLGVVAAWLAVWASGSRTAVGGALFGLAFFLVRAAWMLRRDRSSWRPAVAAACVVLGVAAVGAFSLRSQSIASRLRDAMPAAATTQSVKDFARYQLWNRNGPYGTAAVRMFEDSPVVGIGVGSFEHFFVDYGYVINSFTLRSTPDNAQNWFRHQLAELGLIGSLGWIAWTVMLSRLLWRLRPADRNALPEAAVKGALLALALVSLIAMPTQNTVVAFTFWTMTFWWMAFHPDALASGGRVPGRGAWIAVWIAAVAFGGLTAYEGWVKFRPPSRAVKYNWPFAYGFSEAESGPFGPYRQAGRHAVIVVDVPMPLMKLTVAASPLAVSTAPLQVKVWRDREEVLSTTLRDASPVTRYVPIPDGRTRIMLETSVDREPGVMIGWQFVEKPK